MGPNRGAIGRWPTAPRLGSGGTVLYYLGSGEYRNRYLGVRIPTTNVQPQQLAQTREFARALANRLFGEQSPTQGEETVHPR